MSVEPGTATDSPCVPSGLNFRDPPEFDHRSFTFQKTISIAHPAWPKEHDIFLTLYTLDNWEEGISHLRTVWLACSLVAGNSFDGYLSRSRIPGDETLNSGSDADVMLKAGKYWFHVPDPLPDQGASDNTAAYLYPIFRDFRHWEYPHGKIPEFWPHRDDKQAAEFSSVGGSIAVHGEDRICRVTGHSSGTQAAHICPVSEQQWFIRNNMQTYLGNGIQNSANVMLLRADLHQVFDDGDFVLVPKQNQGFVLHFLKPSADLLPKHNNQNIHPTERLSGHCLLVRFAWAIFRQLEQFVDFEGDFSAKNRIYVDEALGPGSGSGSGSTGKKGKRPASDAAPGERPAKQGPATRSRGRSRGRSGRRSGTRAAIHDDSTMNDNETTTTGTSCSIEAAHDDECESCENREDQRIIQRVCPELHEVENPSELDPKLQDFYHEIVVYPGHRRVKRMKERALEERRPTGYDPASGDEALDFETV